LFAVKHWAQNTVVGSATLLVCRQHEPLRLVSRSLQARSAVAGGRVRAPRINSFQAGGDTQMRVAARLERVTLPLREGIQKLDRTLCCCCCCCAVER